MDKYNNYRYTCEPCDQSKGCLTCYNQDQCKSCVISLNYYLHADIMACKLSIEKGYFYDGNLNLECKKCDEGCLACFYAGNNCSECNITLSYYYTAEFNSCKQ